MEITSGCVIRIKAFSIEEAKKIVEEWLIESSTDNDKCMIDTMQNKS